MITTLHTLSLVSITHHTNSPRVWLRRPPRARPQLTRPPLLGRRCLLRCCAARRARQSCVSPFAHPSSQRATRPSPPPTRRRVRLPPRARRPPRARPQLTRPSLLGPRPPPGAPPATSATPDARAAPSPAASAATAHPGVATRLPLPTPVLCHLPRPLELRKSARPPVLAARCPTIARHPSPDAPPAASAVAAHPVAAARPPPTVRRPARLPPRAWPQLTSPPAMSAMPNAGAEPRDCRRRRREGHPCK